MDECDIIIVVIIINQSQYGDRNVPLSQCFENPTALHAIQSFIVVTNLNYFEKLLKVFPIDGNFKPKALVYTMHIIRPDSRSGCKNAIL